MFEPTVVTAHATCTVLHVGLRQWTFLPCDVSFDTRVSFNA